MELTGKQKRAIDNAKFVQSRYQSELLNKKNVNSVGIGYIRKGGKMTKDIGLIVTVEAKKPMNALAVEDQLPSEIEGVRLDVHEVGKLEKHAESDDPVVADLQKRVRPLQPGYSVGNAAITAGTIGFFAIRDGRVGVVSNAHVMCQDPSKDVSQQTENRILQPGAYDGGTLTNDKIGVLKSEVLIQPGKTNYVDAAWADLDNQANYDPTIPGVGKPSGMDETPGQLGEVITKVGRTTGKTTGTITQVNVTANVSYGSFTATFSELVMTGGAMSAGGDSGSLGVVDGKAKYHLFAGSSSTTLFYHVIKAVNAMRLTPLWGDTPAPTTDVKVDWQLEPTTPGPDTQTYRVYGTVTSGAGNPINGASLGIAELTVATDETGNYEFNGIAAGTYNMTCQKTGYISQNKDVQVGVGQSAPLDESIMGKLKRMI